MSEGPTREPFDANQGDSAVRLPSAGSIGNVTALDHEGYVSFFEGLFKDMGGSGLPAALKSLNLPPGDFAYGRIEYMPDPNATGVLPWPGIAPEALQKIARENVAPQVVIGMRCDDVQRYSDLSTEIWKPGWRIEAREKKEEQSDTLAKEILEAQRFILNSNAETTYAQARKRDEARCLGFKNFLAAAVRDMLTYDGLALWTDMTGDDKVKGYSLLPAGNIRLTAKRGYKGDPKIFAVGVDQGGKVVQEFTREQLTFYVRNTRTDVAVSGDLFASGYGYSEIEIAIRLIQGFQNAIDLNVDVFNRNGIPNAILTITGGSVTQRQLDIFNRLWTNMKRGITKAWAMPVVGLSGEAKFELVDLSSVKGMEGYYEEWMNMLAGLFCCIYRFPARRLGYRISGKGRDTEPLPDSSGNAVDEDDPGLAPLLGHIEAFINEYLLWSRWPHLQFVFTGKNPKEDARQYEAKMNACTFDEQRVMAGRPKLVEMVKDHKELEPLAIILGLCPADPGKTNAFQTMAATMLEAMLGLDTDGKDGESAGAPFKPSKDPARSEAHGKISGVRRNSATETKRAA
jgi:hypothetical protein